jgi:hypothetical protein
MCGIDSNEANLGKKYYWNFMKRSKDKIYSTKVTKKDLKRLEWGTYFNIEKMYKLIHEELVLSGVAQQRLHPQYYNFNGDVLSLDAGAYGLPTDIDLVAPDFLLFVDECGSNTDMKKDKQQ